MDTQQILKWKEELKEFEQKTAEFVAGEFPKNTYKGYSGRFGSYAQKEKDKKLSMIRLRTPAGRITHERMEAVVSLIRDYNITRMHFTTCQAIQFHDVDPLKAAAVLSDALDKGIIIMGGGGDYPRNTMCSPLTGTEADEYFDVMPYALTAGDYALHIIDLDKMPRKYKIGFSNSPANVPHATFRDLGFVARPNGNFDVYSAGGLGNNPKFGVLCEENISPADILIYVKAMYETFCAYGNYANRGKARTRYMQEILGSPEAYRAAFLEKVAEVKASGEDFSYTPADLTISKRGDGSAIENRRAFAQKQAGLYTVEWHPIGGNPDVDTFVKVCELLSTMDETEIRLAPDETAYIINLTGAEAQQVIDLTAADSANSLFETSVSCIGASTCQVGVRDSQALLKACVEAVAKADLPDGALPQIHISGCPSSCGTHQTGIMGFRGAAKRVDGVMKEAFSLFINGCDLQGMETMGREVNTVETEKIPAFLVALGETVAASGMSFAEWNAANPEGIDEVLAPYL